MFNKEKIAKMKKGVIVVNNARGGIMDAQAVADACSSGHIAGKIFYSFNQSFLKHKYAAGCVSILAIRVYQTHHFI
jgi:lactate dehydrogenase-like 2-hydroxyacid dehydrogenase